MVEQAVSPASRACGRFFHSFFTDTDCRLGAEMAETLRQLEYLQLHGDSNTSMNPEVQAAVSPQSDRPTFLPRSDAAVARTLTDCRSNRER